MAKKREVVSRDPFVRQNHFTMSDGSTITEGDIVKVKGIWGSQFKFLNYVTNPETNVSWVDCIQLERGLGCGFRSFYPDRIKRIPKKRGKKRGKRTARLDKAS